MKKRTQITEDRAGHGPRNQVASRSTARERLVVEHADGWLEDLGFVDFELRPEVLDTRMANLNARNFRLQWRSDATARSSAAMVTAADISGNRPARPLEVRMRNGERQYWFFGSNAESRLTAANLYSTRGQRQLTT